eukprot:1156505-Pelagomonas_calceolata.AAC.8
MSWLKHQVKAETQCHGSNTKSRLKRNVKAYPLYGAPPWSITSIIITSAMSQLEHHVKALFLIRSPPAASSRASPQAPCQGSSFIRIEGA